MVNSVVTIKRKNGESVKFHRFEHEHVMELSDEVKNNIKNSMLSVAREDKASTQELRQIKINFENQFFDVEQLVTASHDPRYLQKWLVKSLVLGGIDEAKAKEVLKELALYEKTAIVDKLIYDIPEVEEVKTEEKKEESKEQAVEKKE